jgi:hypothetical protein
MKQHAITLGYRGWEIQVFRLGETAFQSEVYLPSGEPQTEALATWPTSRMALDKAKDFIDRQLPDYSSLIQHPPESRNGERSS